VKALAVFHGHGCHPLDRLLKPGFRHCFAAVLAGDYWVRLDGMAGVPAVDVVAAGDFDLAAFYRQHEYVVVETEQRARPLRTPFVAANCVGVVKAVLGVRAPFAVTPYRLFRHLKGMQDAAR
jgi:hypothetical protein